ncbi:MAG: pseudouridine synthase [Chitinophagaceae bacterium]
MKHAYYIIYKPFKTLSQFSAVPGKKTLGDFFTLQKDIYPVGRLDEDSEGLLLLTNDTSVNKKLLDPLFAHTREYLVQVEGTISNDAITNMSNGIAIHVNGKIYITKPCVVNRHDDEPNVPERIPPIRFRKNIPTSWIRIILKEGKNRQVRKMTAATGFPTLRLLRTRIGGITLGNLQPGEIKMLDKTAVYKKLWNEPG